MRSRKRPAGPADEIELRVVAVWEDTLGWGSILVYLGWVRHFRMHCKLHGLDERESLTLAAVTAFSKEHYGLRSGKKLKAVSRLGARSALHAWSCALRTLGFDVPDWHEPPKEVVLPPTLRAYRTYRWEQSGVAKSTIKFDLEIADEFREQVRAEGRRLSNAKVKDVDVFIAKRSSRLRPKAVALACSSLRAFLSFLYATGRIRQDLTAWVERPKTRPLERPPRALPPRMLKRLIECAKKNGLTRLRDHALLLTMATYGLGGAEASSLLLASIDWKAETLSVRRPKTGVVTLLPLLPGVAAAIAEYLRDERPKAATSRAIFVSGQMPHDAMTTAGIRSVVRKNAELAGISAPMLGANILRHSHACQQIENGTNVKVVSEVLGHRDPKSTSAYVRVAIETLRKVAVEVPAL